MTNDDLKALLREARELVASGDFRTGLCCCGEPMDTHGYMGNHGPVDEGDRAVMEFTMRVNEALAAAAPKP